MQVNSDMRTKKQVTVKMTEQFAKDLNLIMASYGITDVSYILRESVACQADAIRDRIAARQAAGKPPYEEDHE